MSDFLSKFSKDNYDKLLDAEHEAETKAELEEAFVEDEIEQITEELNEAANEASENESPEEVVTETEPAEEDSATEPLESEVAAEEPIESKVPVEDAVAIDHIDDDSDDEEEVAPVIIPARALKPVPETSRRRKAEPSRRDDRDEEVEIDKSYHKKKMIRYGIIGGSAVLVCILAFLAFLFFNQVQVKNFVGTPVSELKTWALKNNIEVETEMVFSIEQDENMIVSQDIPEGSNIQKGSVIKVQVSKGADPDERIALPDFSKMNTTQVKAWVDSNKAENVKIVEQFDENVPKGTYLKMEFKDKNITAATYTRADGLSIYMSKGKEVFEKNIEVPDFTNKSKAEVEAWAKTNMIEMTYDEASSDTVPAEMIVSQSIKAGEKVAKKDKMTVVVSVGKASVVPWFGNATAETAGELGSQHDLQVIVVTEYSENTPFGELIWQSESSGTYLTGTDKTVKVYYSLGKPYIENLIGRQENEIPAYFFNFKSKNANITYTIKYVSSSEPKGTIVWMSKYSEYVGMNTHIEIHVSR
ncbi:PASTA domain-containing protein [Culicoidibacter larvae]|uniref:PASTA domain-containing protein n=1 Tax=Culicoidibacter larvae TaxID=2579976 RepID=A0A5R8QC46_9FIRM|nr:PASTA domain-containing protein [Culicoidibacter larvae]TLG73860.1 PASTA domain-containing protein [Culicoidibacter larvae]